MASVIIPIAYLIVIFGGLYIFSVLYRRHIAGKSTHYICIRGGIDLTYQLFALFLQESTSTRITSHIRNAMPTSPFCSRILRHQKLR